MKRLLAFFVLITILSSLTACNTANAEGGEGTVNGDDFYLTGIVKSVSDYVEIDVIDSDYAFGIYWVNVSEATKLLDASGNAILLSDIKVGDTVEFGGLLGSAPVQPVHPFSSKAFIDRGGRIPAPMQSLKN